jgi:addiction module HigA family antidote
MAIDRKAVAGMDFSALSTGRKLKPVHPGEVLLKDFIEPMGLTRYKVAKSINVPQRRIDEICAGQRAVSADTALRLGRLFGLDPQVWMNLQAQYDLEIAERDLRKRLAAEVTPLAEPSA